MIRASVNSEDISRWGQKPVKILEYVQMRVNRLLIMLQAKIVGEKLQGQVLRHITGKLSRSVVVIPAELRGTVVTGYVEAAAPPAAYGVGHERGTDSSYEIVAVRKKALMWIAAGGAKRFATKVMHPPIKRRSFMVSSLNEMRTQILEELSAATAEGMGK